MPRHYSTGESVFGEGEPCSGLYVVESGHVRLFKRSANGRERVLSIDGPGSSFAGLPVFRWRKLPASVTAIDDATLLFVSKQDFQALCLAHPHVALKVMRVVGIIEGDFYPRRRRLIVSHHPNLDSNILETRFTAVSSGRVEEKEVRPCRGHASCRDPCHPFRGPCVPCALTSAPCVRSRPPTYQRCSASVPSQPDR